MITCESCGRRVIQLWHINGKSICVECKPNDVGPHVHGRDNQDWAWPIGTRF